MYLKTLSLGDIHPYERNPRINDRAVEPVMKSIQKDGYRARIIVDKDGIIIAGHTRYEAMKRLGWTEAEVWIADDMTPEQIADYRIRDNLTADFAEWDFSELEAEIAEMDLDFDMSEFDGFEDIQGGVSDTPTAEEDDFDVDAPVEAKAKRGDIYQLGRHRLICGDSTDIAVVDRLMDGVKADMVFCDAPYGYKYESNYQDKYEMLQNDDKILDFIPAIWGAMKDNCPVYEFCGWQSLKQWLEYFENTSLDLKNVIIWKKNNWSMGDLKGAYAGQYEVILYLNKGRVELNGARDTDIWEFDREPPKMHPTMKPIELIAYALNKSSKKGDVVLDCFGGSGSTLIACEQLNRKCYMAELDPHYCDVIISRYENFTGEEATKL